MSKEPEGDRAAMVEWYSPLLLIQTGIKVAISTIFGVYSDRRLTQSVIAGPGRIHDFSTEPMHAIPLDGTAAPAPAAPPRDSIWLDFVADTGDGWDPTYAIAHAVTRPLTVKDSKGVAHETERGAVLVFGGDMVYPSSTPETYEQRLLMPYEAAFDAPDREMKATKPDNPYVFAIPGNHDWYDSLGLFSQQFCSNIPFAGCLTPQRRTYFALQLPHGWWFLGIDVQLGSNLDVPQVEYFTKVGAQMKDGDRVILCIHEPQWILRRYLGKYDAAYKRDYIGTIEQHILKRKVSVFLSGDFHHYRRHENEHTGVQKITAGGGGAFLHPTHGKDVSELHDEFKLQCCYPGRWTSWWLTWRNLLFPYFNPRFGVVTGLLYLLVALNVVDDCIRFFDDLMIRAAAFSFVDFLMRFFNVYFLESYSLNQGTANGRTTLLFWAVLIGTGFVFFTDVRKKRFRIIFGLTHAAAHFSAIGYLIFVSLPLFFNYDVHEGGEFDASVIGKPRYGGIFGFALAIFLGGWLIGSMIMGIYLLISLNLFKVHWNEAFSSLRIMDWKNFLRLKIAPDGSLTIYPIGIRRVSREWVERKKDDQGPRQVPVQQDKHKCALIEPPIVVARHEPNYVI